MYRTYGYFPRHLQKFPMRMVENIPHHGRYTLFSDWEDFAETIIF